MYKIAARVLVIILWLVSAGANCMENPSQSSLLKLMERPDFEKTLAANTQSVLPTAAESKWQEIPWQNNLMSARQKAQAQNKPLFMWIMNGNPMGCT
jgi:hypothetical protein